MEVLFGLLFHPDELVRWRAVETLGVAAQVRAAGDLEAVRERIRRIMWSMNHESGNAMWLAPDAAGEILASVPDLVEEFARPVASFIGLEPFVHGVHRAVARVAGVRPGPVAYLAPYLEHALSSPDPCIRAHAALALARIDPGEGAAVRDRLSQDGGSLVVYDRSAGELVTTSVARLVSAGIPR